MITRQTIKIDGIEYINTFSDKYKIVKKGTDEVYEEAVDLVDSDFEYEESDELLENNFLDNELI